MYGKQLKLLYILYISALLFLNYLRTVSATFFFKFFMIHLSIRVFNSDVKFFFKYGSKSPMYSECKQCNSLRLTNTRSSAT